MSLSMSNPSVKNMIHHLVIRTASYAEINHLDAAQCVHELAQCFRIEAAPKLARYYPFFVGKMLKSVEDAMNNGDFGDDVYPSRESFSAVGDILDAQSIDEHEAFDRELFESFKSGFHMKN